MTIRDRVQSIAEAMAADDPPPADLRRYEVVLSGLLSHIHKHVASSEVSYKRILATYRGQYETAAEAKMHAEATDQYREWRESVAVKDSTQEMLRTLRSTLRSQSEEMRMTR